MINIDLKRIEIIPLGTVSSGEGGSANADLSNYYTKGEVNTKLQRYSVTSHTHTEYLTEDALNSNYYNKSEVDSLILSGVTGGGNVDMGNFYTKEELDTIMLSNHISDIASWDNKLIGLNISGNMRNEIQFATINGKSIINTTDNIVISGEGGSYDDTALSNRVSAIEIELLGMTQEITELNNMVG